MKQIVIIGGGISGLAAAYRCEQLAPDVAVTLVEREHRLGGKLLTERSDGFVVEGAPDSFLSRKPRGIGLCAELGLASQLQGRNPQHEKSFVCHHGQLHPLPTGLSGLIPTNLDALTHSTLISPAGQQRLAQEPTIPPAETNGDESVGHFLTRRLGREVYEQLIEPLMSGIYAGDGDQLSLAATFPQLRQLELRHGSLLKGLQAGQQAQNGQQRQAADSNTRTAPASTYPPFVSLPGGMATLVETLVAQLTHTKLVTGVGVEQVESNAGGFDVLLKDGRTLLANALICATPAFVTAKLLERVDPALASLHQQIPYASAVIVTLAYQEQDLPHALDGYGYVIPQVEGGDLLACSWSSSKWVKRAPAGWVLLRVYLGRYGRQDVTRLTDPELITRASEEVRRTVGIDASPGRVWIHRWPLAMPQYLLGHVERLAEIEAHCAGLPGLFLAGAAYRGVGIPDCIESGEEAARAAVRFLDRE